MFRYKLAAVAAATAVTAGLGLAGAGAANAQSIGEHKAKPSATVKRASYNYAHLAIRSVGGGNYSVTISGHATLTSVTPRNFSISLYSDDTWFDENLFDKNWMTTFPNGDFWTQFTIDGDTLDEDWGQDEVYARAHIWDPALGSFQLTTNVVTGSF
ncbi:hypothetical protein [Motilibacter deserti]|uniref:PLAT domain-containing protein n=1 Tax=Motilibacter deserti TaxID=2714956 RepID=A0ABX0GR34_9ACTN|nr:hypothetical protein [Motilibacter deserti]NHC12324.1 hypothetical protein [Motilibacter deserti]